jgi:hypothetical protein
VSKRIVRVPFAEPELTGKRKAAIKRVAANQERFFKHYERLRLRYQAAYAQLVHDLHAHRIEVTHVTQTAERPREKSPHRYMFIRGISAEGAVEWERAAKTVDSAYDGLLGLQLELTHSFELGGRQGWKMHELPKDIDANLDALRTYVKTRGTTRVPIGRLG